MIFKDCAILWRLLFNPTQRMLFGSSKKGVREFAFSVFREERRVDVGVSGNMTQATNKVLKGGHLQAPFMIP